MEHAGLQMHVSGYTANGKQLSSYRFSQLRLFFGMFTKKNSGWIEEFDVVLSMSRVILSNVIGAICNCVILFIAGSLQKL